MFCLKCLPNVYRHNFFIYFKLCIYSFIWKTVLYRERGRDNIKSSSTDSLFKWSNSPGWTSLKTGTWNFIWFSHMAAGTQVPEPSSTAFQGTLAGSWIARGQPRTQIGKHMGCQHFNLPGHSTVSDRVLCREKMLVYSMAVKFHIYTTLFSN